MLKKNISLGQVYLIVILLSLLITLGTLLYVRFTTNEGVYLKNDLTVVFRSEAYINDFISYIDGKLISNYKVDTNEVGLKELAVTFKNKYGFIVSKNITIEVIDITPPIIVVNNPYTIVKGSIDSLEESIFCADDYDDNISCNIVGEYDLNNIGKYNLEVIATDRSGNTTSKEFVLNVIEKKPSSNNGGTSSYTNFIDIT